MGALRLTAAIKQRLLIFYQRLYLGLPFNALHTDSFTSCMAPVETSTAPDVQMPVTPKDPGTFNILPSGCQNVNALTAANIAIFILASFCNPALFLFFDLSLQYPVFYRTAFCLAPGLLPPLPGCP